MIIVLRPPGAAGALRVGASVRDTVDILRQLGDPQAFHKTPDSRPAWAVHRPSGLFVSAFFDVDGRVEAIEFGRPDDHTDDAVTYNGLDVFATPAADLVMQLRRHTTVHEEENGHTFTAPRLLLAFWRPTTPEAPDDEDGRFFESVLLARPGYYDQSTGEP
jgi:hypothetical protein